LHDVFKSMKKSILLLLSIIVISSCGEYQKMLRNPDSGLKYAMAEKMYNKGKYKKALKLMEQVVPVYRGKPQAEKLMFMYSNTYYQLEDYYLSGYQFERFVVSYPKSDSVELASYKSASSYYELSPIYSLDQTDTYIALEKLQSFIDTYPNSKYRTESNNKVNLLTLKLQKKDIEIAMQYLKTGLALNSYKNAIAAFENFISDHPGSIYRIDAYYGRFQAQYELALQSVPQKVEERLIKALEYYDDFLKYYSESELSEQANEIIIDIGIRLGTTEVPS
jgi:outer membrane protein assembly factor BamD